MPICRENELATTGDFFFRFAEETFETPRADHFSSNFGLFAANHDKFFAFHLQQKRVFTTSNFSFFFLLKHSSVLFLFWPRRRRRRRCLGMKNEEKFVIRVCWLWNLFLSLCEWLRNIFFLCVHPRNNWIIFFFSL